MRDFSRGVEHLSINTATVRKQLALPAIIEACAKHKVAIEINANPRRLDIDWRWVDYALDKGVMLSINPDAHEISEYANCRYGVLAGQKGGLTKKSNLSSFSLKEFETYLGSVSSQP